MDSVKGLWSGCFIMHCIQAGRSSPDQDADVLLRFIKKAFPTLCGHTGCLEVHHQGLHSSVFSERWMKPGVTDFYVDQSFQIFPLWEKADCDKWVFIEGHQVLLGRKMGQDRGLRQTADTGLGRQSGGEPAGQTGGAGEGSKHSVEPGQHDGRVSRGSHCSSSPLCRPRSAAIQGLSDCINPFLGRGHLWRSGSGPGERPCTMAPQLSRRALAGTAGAKPGGGKCAARCRRSHPGWIERSFSIGGGEAREGLGRVSPIFVGSWLFTNGEISKQGYTHFGPFKGVHGPRGLSAAPQSVSVTTWLL